MSDWDDDDFGGLDDIFVPRDPDTGDPMPDGRSDDVPRSREPAQHHPSRLERWLERRRRRGAS